MKKKITFPTLTILISLLTLLLPIGQAFSLPALNPKPYICGDAGWRSLEFEDGYGGKIFKSSLLQTGFQVGMRFWDFFGVELGYERTRREGNTARIGPNQMVLGRNIMAGYSEQHVTESGFQGQHLDFVLFLPTHAMSMFDVIFGIGIVRSKLLHNTSIVVLNDVLLDDPLKRTFYVKQTHARVFGGIQNLIDLKNAIFFKKAGVRLLGTWENTSQFKNEPPLETRDAFASAKNSYLITLGIILST